MVFPCCEYICKKKFNKLFEYFQVGKMIGNDINIIGIYNNKSHKGSNEILGWNVYNELIINIKNE